MTDNKYVKRQKARLIDYKKCFDTEAGRKVLYDLMLNYYMKPSYTEDPYRTSFNEGCRFVVNMILDKTKTTPEKLDQLIERAIEHEHRSNSDL